MKKYILMILAGAFLAVLIQANTILAVEPIKVERIFGSNRYETAVEISKATFENSDTAIIAYGGDFPDAMVGGTLASDERIPILLVGKDIPTVVQEELIRLGVENIYIIGGDAVISRSIESSLSRDYKVSRLAGENRFFTAMEVNYARYEVIESEDGDPPILHQGDYTRYFLASGKDFPDALAVAPLVGQIRGFPFGHPDYNFESRMMFLGLYTPGEMEYGWYIIGGVNAVPHHDFDYTWGFPEGGTRIAGKNRYGTAVEIAKMYPEKIEKTIDTVVLSSGLNYPDALASAPLVSTRNAVLLLTDPNALSKETKDYLLEQDIEKVIVTGGESAVSENVLEEIKGLE